MTIDEFIIDFEQKSYNYEHAMCDEEDTSEARLSAQEKWEHYSQLAEWLTQLKEYQQLEADGRLVKLPCKVGDTVYEIVVNTDACYECACFEKGYLCDDYCENDEVKDEDGDTYLFNPQYSDKLYCPKHFWEITEYCLDNIDRIFNRRNDFGSTIFLTREEAEAKLVELRGAE